MTRISSIAYTWGSTPLERALVLPCDRFLSDPDDIFFRAVSINASASVIFRWLCQLRVAPYSYDWIDNAGRPSPRLLIPGLEQLAVGQRIMTIFELVDFKTDSQLTMVMKAPQAIALFGKIAITYFIVPESSQRCRLVVKMPVCYPRGGIWSTMRHLLPWGDMLMMRKQLLTIKNLAQRQASRVGSVQRDTLARNT